MATPSIIGGPRAKGKWSQDREERRWALATDVYSVYTFQSRTGYRAVMKRRHGRRAEPYICQIFGPDGALASRLSPQGHRIEGMEISLKLKDAKITVEEAVYEVERQATAREPEETAVK